MLVEIPGPVVAVGSPGSAYSSFSFLVFNVRKFKKWYIVSFTRPYKICNSSYGSFGMTYALNIIEHFYLFSVAHLYILVLRSFSNLHGAKIIFAIYFVNIMCSSDCVRVIQSGRMNGKCEKFLQHFCINK